MPQKVQAKKTTGLGRTWDSSQRKEPVHHKTTQGNGRSSRPRGTRKLSRGQG